MEKIKLALLSLLKRFGLIVQLYSPKHSETLLLQWLIKKRGINKVFDVGANKGQFGKSLIDGGLKADIISFEPLQDAYQELKQKADKVPNWTTFNNAVGSKSYETSINVSANSHSSSLLKVNENHLDAEQTAEIVAEQKVQVKPLNEMVEAAGGDKILLKIDTQGFELEVLKGSEQLFDFIDVILVELSMVPLYEDSAAYSTIINYLEEKGYMLYQIFPEFVNPTSHQLLQANGVFVKK